MMMEYEVEMVDYKSSKYFSLKSNNSWLANFNLIGVLFKSTFKSCSQFQSCTFSTQQEGKK